MLCRSRFLPAIALALFVPALVVACADDDTATGETGSGSGTDSGADGTSGDSSLPPITGFVLGDSGARDHFVPDRFGPASDAGLDSGADAGVDADADAGPPPDPTSSDGLMNGTETDVDCGGGAPTNAPACPVTRKCEVVGDCLAGAACDPTSKRCTRAGHLYAAYYTPNLAVSYASASTRSADSTPVATSMAAAGAGAVAVDAKNDILYASSLTDGKIYIVESGSTSNAGPTRTIAGIAQPTGLAVDGAKNRLFVASLSGEKLLVFDDASTLSGTPAPSRTVTYPAGEQPFSAVYDAAHDRLFVSVRSHDRIDVFDHAATMNGTLAATRSRVIGGSSTTIASPQQIAYDPIWDDLYVANTGAGFQVAPILAFGGASTWSGNKAPSRKIGVAGLVVTGVSVDPSRDELYYSGTTWFKIGALTGAHTFDRTVASTLDLGRTFTGTNDLPTQIHFEPTQD